MSAAHKQAAAELRGYIADSNRLHRQYTDDPAFRETYQRLIDLQLGYFLPQYENLCDRPGYEAAVQFVINDLTGPGIASRDQDLARVEPIMTRFLPTKALHSLALAMQLNSRVLGINLAIAHRLESALASGQSISEKVYCLASREVASYEDCLELIHMTRRAGESLDRFARAPMIHSLLRSMKVPARLGGVIELHAFLEKGLATFTGIDDVGRFLDVMEARMTEVFYRVFAEDPTRLHDEALAA